MNQLYDVLIIGGGASGLIAAITAAELGQQVLLLEKSDRIGRKILASGNGRCNLMNHGEPVYYGDSVFAESVLHRISFPVLSAFFHRYGLVLSEETDGRIYPFSHQSSTVLSILKKAIRLNSVSLMTHASVTALKTDNSYFSVSLSDGRIYSSRRVIVTCGGAAQPRLGGTCDGYSLLESLGHTLVPVYPSLVPVITDHRSISGLSGLRVHCDISLYEEHTLLHRETGELLFTDYGISGICVMQCARFLYGRSTWFEANFCSGAFDDLIHASNEIRRRRNLFSSFSPVAILEGLIPEKLSYAVMKQAGIPLKGETAGDLSDEDLDSILHACSHYRIKPVDTKGFDFAQVTAGGISCDEFNPDTMESRLIPGLYAAGEVLNVDGDCGGYNLMFAFASGMIAGQNGNRREVPE